MQETRTLQSKIEQIKNIPTLPGVVSKMTSMIHDPHVSTESLAQIISRDQVLSAKVLKMINSAFYGFPGRISSVNHALVLLGFSVVKGMLISTSVFDMMNKSMIGMWEHSLGCATLAGIMARRLKEPESEEVFIAGLLHDIGKVIVQVVLPDDSDRIFKKCKEDGLYVYEAEEKILGVDHTRVADWVSKKWNLPENISEPMIFHHDPSHSKKYARRTAMVHLSDVLVQGMGFGDSGSPFVPPLDPWVLKILEADMGFVEDVLLELDENMDAIREFSQEE